MKERDYESLRAMRVAPTITTAEEVIRTQPKIKLPDRRAITLWNSPELSQFRGVSEGLNEEEERRHVAQAAQLDVRQAARAGGVPQPDIAFMQQAAAQANQQQGAMGQHLADMMATNQHQQRAMAAEMAGAVQGLFAANAEAANRQRVADGVTRDLVDRRMAEVQRLVAAREAVAPVTNIDSSVHTTNHMHQAPHVEMTQHNATLNYIGANLQGIGIQMQKNNQTQEQMIREVGAVVAEVERQNRAAPAGMVFAVSGSGGPPPPAPGAAGILRSGPHPQTAGNPQTLFPAQDPRGGPGSGPSGSSGGAAPSLVNASAAQHFAINTPRGPRSRSPTGRARAKDVTRGLGLPTPLDPRDDAPAVLQADKRKSEGSSSSTKKLQVLGAEEKAADAARAREQRAEVARQKEQKKNDAFEERKQKRVTAVKTRQAAENKKASDKVEAEVQKEVAKANKALADSEALAKVRAAAAKFDAEALAQGRGPKPKAKPRKSVAEKRKDMDNRDQAGGGQPSRPRIEDRPPDATDPPEPPAPPKRPRAKAAAKPRRPKMSAATIAPDGPGDPGIVGGQKPVYEERGLYPALPAGLPEMPEPASRPKRKALNMMTAQQMAALVQSTQAAPATTKPTKSAKPKAVASSAPASLIKLIQDAATLPKGMGGSVPQQRAARRRTVK